jgi:hypothetical protein
MAGRARTSVCPFGDLGGLKPRMPMPRSRLRLVAGSADSCVTPGCPLPGQGAGGWCAPCASVRVSVFVLCQRLLARDLARLEHRAPGLTAAAVLALGVNGAERAGGITVGPADPSTWPQACVLAALDALLVELRSRGTAS